MARAETRTATDREPGVRLFLRAAALLSVLLLGACTAGPVVPPVPETPAPEPPAPVEPVAFEVAMRQLLEISGQRSIARLSKRGALADDPLLHIPLPPILDRAARYLTLQGYSAELQVFEARINHTAELALADFAQPLSDTVQALDWPPARNLADSDQAATAYLRRAGGAALLAQLQTWVDLAMAQSEVDAEYERLIEGAGPLGPFLAEARADIAPYLSSRALEALFLTMGEQEMRLRNDPEGGGVEILRRWYEQSGHAPESMSILYRAGKNIEKN